MKKLLLLLLAFAIFGISLFVVSQRHTTKATYYTPSPNPTATPCEQYNQTDESEWESEPCKTPTATPSATPSDSPTPTATPKVETTPAPAAPPEWSEPCFYLRDSEECKTKQEVFPGEDKAAGPRK